MPNTPSGGPNSAFEKNFRAQFTSLNTRLKYIENDLKALTAKVMSSTDKSASYWKGLRKDIQLLYSDINIQYSRWAGKEIPKVYADTIKSQMKHIRKLKSVTSEPLKTTTELNLSKASKQIVNSLYEDAVASMISAGETGQTNLLRVTRATQQTLIAESFIDIEVAQGFEAGNLGKAAKTIENELNRKIIEGAAEGRFVQAGKFKYTPSYYAEMVSRVKFHEAQAYASIMTANNYGTDLVIVSSHNTNTAICLPFEGKIFSISGKSKDFPPLTITPPFHPNCLHLLFPQFESALQLSGQLQGFIDFSNGKADRPPRPASFIPVSERSV